MYNINTTTFSLSTEFTFKHARRETSYYTFNSNRHNSSWNKINFLPQIKKYRTIALSKMNNFNCLFGTLYACFCYFFSRTMMKIFLVNSLYKQNFLPPFPQTFFYWLNHIKTDNCFAYLLFCIQIDPKWDIILFNGNRHNSSGNKKTILPQIKWMRIALS